MPKFDYFWQLATTTILKVQSFPIGMLILGLFFSNFVPPLEKLTTCITITLTKQHLLVWCDATMTPRAGIEWQVQGIDYIYFGAYTYLSTVWWYNSRTLNIILCNSKHSMVSRCLSKQLRQIGMNRYEWDFVGKRNEAAHHYDRGSRS